MNVVRCDVLATMAEELHARIAVVDVAPERLATTLDALARAGHVAIGRGCRDAMISMIVLGRFDAVLAAGVDARELGEDLAARLGAGVAPPCVRQEPEGWLDAVAATARDWRTRSSTEDDVA